MSRGASAALAFASFGLVLSLGYYPALAAQISPKQVFESYQRLARGGEPLALLGADQGRVAAYYTGGKAQTLATVHDAHVWLAGGKGSDASRRWLVARAKDLPQLNARHRTETGANVPVLDARSSEILLVSSSLRDGERNQNPFAEWLLDEPRQPAVQLDVMLGDQLHNLGWEITDLAGRPVGALRPQTDYLFRIYYTVKKPISGNWKTFIHIDGHGRRHNGDHETLEGKYPLHLWRVGDHVVDVHRFRLEPNFTPGKYEVLYGLFIAERRLEVKRGAHHENRVRGGFVEVK